MKTTTKNRLKSLQNFVGFLSIVSFLMLFGFTALSPFFKIPIEVLYAGSIGISLFPFIWMFMFDLDL
jgi:cytochrome c-type biogenesis protein CcmE